MTDDQNVEQDVERVRLSRSPSRSTSSRRLRKERDEYLDALQRLKAEFDNYRKRVARDQQELAARAHERLVKELVPILDDLERALEAATGHEEATLDEGIRLIHRQFSEALAKEGLTEVSTDGKFDPHTQEALLSQPSDAEEGDVIQVAAEGLPARRPRAAAGAGRDLSRGGWLSRSTKRWASRRTRRRTRSRRRTASSCARCIRTRTPATRSGSRRCRARTTSCPTPTSASSTTGWGRRTAAVSPGGTTFDFGDFDLGDIFGGIFGGGRGGGQQPQRGQRGNDVEVEVRVSFEDALRGVQVTVPVQLELACHTCHGTGAAPGTAPTICPQCDGSGVVATSQGLFALQQPCPRCHGMGSIVETPCPTCHGSGRERRTKRYTVKIPAGVKDGTRIKLKGKGEAGYGGAPAGDLYVVSRVEPSKIYERRGDDLIISVPVSYPTAALGGTVEVLDAGGRGLAEGAERHRGRQAPAHQGPRRAAAQGLGQGRRARADQDRGAEARLEEAARAARAAAEGRLVVPDRPRYMISVAAELVGMHPQTLRIYEQRGLVRPQRTAGNTRLYSDRDVERLRLIQRLTTELGLESCGRRACARDGGRAPAHAPQARADGAGDAPRARRGASPVPPRPGALPADATPGPQRAH